MFQKFDLYPLRRNTILVSSDAKITRSTDMEFGSQMRGAGRTRFFRMMKENLSTGFDIPSNSTGGQLTKVAIALVVPAYEPVNGCRLPQLNHRRVWPRITHLRWADVCSGILDCGFGSHRCRFPTAPMAVVNELILCDLS